MVHGVRGFADWQTFDGHTHTHEGYKGWRWSSLCYDMLCDRMVFVLRQSRLWINRGGTGGVLAATLAVVTSSEEVESMGTLDLDLV